MGKSCLVTGGAGFIGSHVCEALLKAGYDVLSVDNFNDFYDPAFKRENIRDIRKTAQAQYAVFESAQCDIRDADALARLFQEYSPAIVLHLAACAGVRPSIAEPLLYASVNITGTINVLECVKKLGIKSFIFASSSSVYGNNEKAPFSETDFVDNPISPYAATKKAGELLCYTYSHLYDIKTACLRFFTVYGPRQRPDLAIYMFTRLIDDGIPIPFFGNGSTLRDYTYIEDIVDGVLKAVNWTMSDTTGYDIFNLGESQTVSLSHMVCVIEEMLGKKAVLQRLPLQPGDMRKTFADIAHAKAVLGYAPRVTFEDGITRFIQWYKDNRRIKQ
jgi:UDP-glucuronate 4-epimerase